ncbi:MAG: cyclic pyranopterin monophosphate synthase MoaC [Desulfovibrio sp.]|nr:cyclic pyranopterin monophosphate synthase MoaC [Desulfovibrio sp.]
MSQLTHLTDDGRVTMVDVSDKAKSKRVAVAEAYVTLAPTTFAALKTYALPKGDALNCAKIAGILAAKKTSELIPLCHSLYTTLVDVRFDFLEETSQIRIEAEARTVGETGVEMEAIVAAEIAAATIYDMCKAMQKDILISGIRLLKKQGGKSGTYLAKG